MNIHLTLGRSPIFLFAEGMIAHVALLEAPKKFNTSLPRRLAFRCVALLHDFHIAGPDIPPEGML
jgi:hypothetical protein